MKQSIYFCTTLVFAIIISFSFIRCNDDDHKNLDISGETKITSFKIANQGDVIFQHEDGKERIIIMLPKGTDNTKLTPEINVSEGAKIMPESGTTVDLSKETVYRVTNGNLYTDYYVSTDYISGKFETFGFGKFKGIIDNDALTVTFFYPQSADAKKLIPSFTYTKGASVTPEPGEPVDFTNPVEYTVNYHGQKFIYKVTAIESPSFAYLGVYNDASSIENPDEKAAYEWFSDNFPNVEYVSFEKIKNGSIDPAHFAAMWWHTDGNIRTLPDAAMDGGVVSKLKNYYKQGGAFFFSSWAVKYSAILGIPNDGKAVNNEWGENNVANGIELSENWGLCFAGQESHPIFKGLKTPLGVKNKVYLLSRGIKVKGHNAIWNFAEDWSEYKNNIEGWSHDSGAKSLASFHWDDDAKSRSVMFEYPPRNSNYGRVVCIGSEAYDWSVVGTNSLKDNLEQLTTNIFYYLTKH